MEERNPNRRRWRTAGLLAGLALGVSAFGGLVLPGLRADTPAAPVEQPQVLSKLADERDCERPVTAPPQI